MTHRRGHGDTGDDGRGDPFTGDPGSARDAALGLTGGDLFLPDFLSLGGDRDISRFGSTRINQIAPPSPKEFYVSLVGLDDIVPPGFGRCWARGKPWIIEQHQSSQTNIVVVYVFTEGECNNPITLRIGDQDITVTGSGNIRNAGTNTSGRLYLGEAAQTLAAALDAAIPGTYTDAHPGMVIWYQFFLSTEMQGLPIVGLLAEWDKNVYDPREFRSVAANGSAGTGDRFDAVDHGDFNPGVGVGLSIEAWFRLDGGATFINGREILDKFSAVTGYRLFATRGSASGVPRFEIAINTTTPVLKQLDGPVGSFPDDGEPHHIAATYDAASGIQRLYADGCLVAEADHSAESNTDLVGNSTAVKINFTGLDYGITDIRFWGDARTASEIRVNYKSHLDGTEAGLLAYWPTTDAAAASTLTDQVTAGLHDATKVGTNVTLVEDHLVGLAPGGASWETLAYTKNPALISAHVVELVNAQQSAGLLVNYNDVADVADHDDTDLTGHATVKRAEFNSVLDGERDYTDWLDYIAEHGYFVWWREGAEIRMREDWIVATADDTLSDAVGTEIVEGSVEWVNGDPSYEDVPELVGVRYIDLNNNDEEGTAYNITPTGSERFLDFIKMLGFNTHEQARRYAIKKNNQYVNEPYLFKCEVNDKAAAWTKWDRIDITLARLGLTSSPFRLMTNPRMVSAGIYQCLFKRYSASSYNETNDSAPVINLSTFPSIGEIPAGPVPTLAEVFDYAEPTQLRIRVRFDEPAWTHTKAIQIEIWNTGETAMLIAPIVVIIGALTEISAGPPRNLEHIFNIPFEFAVKVRCRIVSSLDAFGDPSAYVTNIFASGFEDPGTPPTPTGILHVQEFDQTGEDVQHYHNIGWTDPTSLYGYPVETVVIVEHDLGVGDWQILNQVTVPPGQISVRVYGIDVMKYGNNNLDTEIDKGRTRLFFRNVFNRVGPTFTTSEWDIGDDPVPPTPTQLVIEQLGDVQQAYLHYKQVTSNYIQGIRMTVEDLDHPSGAQTVNYFNAPNGVGVVDWHYPFPLFLYMVTINPTTTSHQSSATIINVLPYNFDFQIGRRYVFRLQYINRNGVLTVTPGQITHTWQQQVRGGLDSSVD